MGNFTYDEQEEDWRDLFIRDDGKILFVAVSGSNDILGYAYGEYNPDGLSSFECELAAIHVQQKFQRQGIGRNLFYSVCKSFSVLGYNSLFLWVPTPNPTRSFYEKLGGIEISKNPWRNNKFFGTDRYEVFYGWHDLNPIINMIIG